MSMSALVRTAREQTDAMKQFLFFPWKQLWDHLPNMKRHGKSASLNMG
jgi:hypothetical protein